MKKLIISLFTIFLSFSFTYALDVTEITPINKGIVKMKLSSEVSIPNNNDELKADIKILKDLIVSYSYRDTDNLKKVNVNLTYDLKENNTYSLLAVFGVKGDIDFSIENIPSEVKITDNEFIEKINILDSKNVEIFYKKDIGGEELLYKVLMNLGTKSIDFKNGFFSIHLQSYLDTFSSYILLVNYLYDSEGNKLDFKETYYEFNTPDYLDEAPVLKNEIAENEDKNKQQVVPINETNTFSGSNNSNDNKLGNDKKLNIEKVAMNSANVPATGAATWILVLFAFLLSGFFFIKNNRK